MVGIAQLVRVPGCGPGGRGFDSHYSPHNYNIIYALGCRQAVRHGILIPASRRFDPFHPSQTFFYGPLAQSVEHLTFNQVVPRSIRGWITNLKICDRGGIGRRARLRIWYLRCGSSSLFGRTKILKRLKAFLR